jgi:hypothetical protein
VRVALTAIAKDRYPLAGEKPQIRIAIIVDLHRQNSSLNYRLQYAGWYAASQMQVTGIQDFLRHASLLTFLAHETRKPNSGGAHQGCGSQSRRTAETPPIEKNNRRV